MDAYEKLEAHFEDLSRFQQIMAVLHWDYATMMPSGGAQARGEQFAALQSLIHERLTDPRVGQWLDEVGDGRELDKWQKANVGGMRHLWTHASCVPTELIQARSRKGTECEMVWRKARKADDFDLLAPHLQEVLELTREVAAVKAEAFGVEPYDALLDRYDPGMTSKRVDHVFEDLAAFLPGFLEDVLERQSKQPEPAIPQGPFSQKDQEKLARRLMEAWTFDFEHGRLDTSHHPFCGGYPGDVRLTTHYNKDNFLRAMMAVLHETGHALYSGGLPEAWRAQPVGRARGMSVHESQSLFVEMQIGRSRPFVHWVAPLYREAFNGTDEAWSEANLYELKTRVQRGLIRVDADEVTYPLHVILRYRLERALLAGEVEVDELPEVWREMMGELVGVVPETDREGCMQDIHWMDGTFGYFPTYTLGALMAAQLFDAMRSELGDVGGAVEEGEFSVIRDWLRRNVHERGCLWTTEQLVEEVTGSKLETTCFKKHLRARYLDDED